jgi:hypothetical protein
MELKWLLALMMALSAFGLTQGMANKYSEEMDDRIFR